MQSHIRPRKNDLGFTLVELLVTIIIIGILAAIAIPGYSRWYPKYKLRSAASDLYSHMHLAKMGAVKDNSSWAILFKKPNADSYTICSGDGDADWTNGCAGFEEMTFNLSDYGFGTSFGHGSATAAISGGFDDDVTFTTPAANVVRFDPRGTCSQAGYVYLANDRNQTFGVGTSIAGVVRLWKWEDSSSSWE